MSLIFILSVWRNLHWICNDNFFVKWNIAGQSEKVKGLTYNVRHASSLNISLNFWTWEAWYDKKQEFIQLCAEHIQQCFQDVHVCSNLLFLISLYGLGSSLQDLLSVCPCEWYRNKYVHIKQVPADVWDACICIRGQDLVHAEILALPQLQICAWGEQKSLCVKTSQTCSEGRCWFSKACRCCFFKTHWYSRRAK